MFKYSILTIAMFVMLLAFVAMVVYKTRVKILNKIKNGAENINKASDNYGVRSISLSDPDFLMYLIATQRHITEAMLDNALLEEELEDANYIIDAYNFILALFLSSISEDSSNEVVDEYVASFMLDAMSQMGGWRIEDID